MPPEEPPIITPKEPRKNWFFRHEFLSSIIAVLLLVIVVGAALWYQTERQTTQETSKICTQAVIVIQNNTTKEIKEHSNGCVPDGWTRLTPYGSLEQYYYDQNWKTYTNTKYGFEFKYSAELGLTSMVNEVGAFFLNLRDKKDIQRFRFILIIQEHSNDAGVSGTQISSTSVNIDGINATKIIYTLNDPHDAAARMVIVKFNQGQNYYQINAFTYEEFLPEFDQILSTFKFVPSTSLGTSEPPVVQELQKGTLKGRATIGPICPVQRADEPCPTPPEAYTSRYIIIYKADGTTEVARKNFDTKGNYQIELAPGTYIIKTLSGINYYASETAVIKAGQTTALNFDIDTGIR